jgi:hypothetical protein
LRVLELIERSRDSELDTACGILSGADAEFGPRPRAFPVLRLLAENRDRAICRGRALVGKDLKAARRYGRIQPRITAHVPAGPTMPILSDRTGDAYVRNRDPCAA